VGDIPPVVFEPPANCQCRLSRQKVESNLTECPLPRDLPRSKHVPVSGVPDSMTLTDQHLECCAPADWPLTGLFPPQACSRCSFRCSPSPLPPPSPSHGDRRSLLCTRGLSKHQSQKMAGLIHGSWEDSLSTWVSRLQALTPNNYHPQFTTPRYGEPLNIIISNLSDPFILTDEGFRQYYKLVLSTSITRDLMFIPKIDRVLRGVPWLALRPRPQSQSRRRRQEKVGTYFGAPALLPQVGYMLGDLNRCVWLVSYPLVLSEQRPLGGNHFRAWKQNGTMADTGAWFLA